MLGYLLNPALQLENIDGKPMVGGWLTVYKAGTTTPYITYRDFESNRNPANIVLDDKGMAVILADDGALYDVYAYDKNGVHQWTRVNVPVAGGSGGGTPGRDGKGIHRLLRHYTNPEVADEQHPAGDWLHDLDALDPSDPSGHPMVTADSLFEWIEDGQAFDLYEIDTVGYLYRYQMTKFEDQSAWWSASSHEEGKACRLEFYRSAVYSKPYYGSLVCYIRYIGEPYMRLLRLVSDSDVWTGHFQPALTAGDNVSISDNVISANCNAYFVPAPGTSTTFADAEAAYNAQKLLYTQDSIHKTYVCRGKTYSPTYGLGLEFVSVESTSGDRGFAYKETVRTLYSTIVSGQTYWDEREIDMSPSTAAVYGSTQDTPGDGSTNVLMYDTWYMDSFGQFFGNKIYWKNGDPDTHKLIVEPGKYIIRTEWFLNWHGPVDYNAHIINGCTEDFSYHWQKYVDRQAIRNLPVTIEFSIGFTFDSATPSNLSITPASLIIQEVV